jgi:hypothetical protein
MDKKPKRPRDVSQLAKIMVDIASGETETLPPERQKDPAAVARGRAGGLKGGKARAEKLTPLERQSQALNAVRSRWKVI